MASPQVKNGLSLIFTSPLCLFLLNSVGGLPRTSKFLIQYECHGPSVQPKEAFSVSADNKIRQNCCFGRYLRPKRRNSVLRRQNVSAKTALLLAPLSALKNHVYRCWLCNTELFFAYSYKFVESRQRWNRSRDTPCTVQVPLLHLRWDVGAVKKRSEERRRGMRATERPRE